MTEPGLSLKVAGFRVEVANEPVPGGVGPHDRVHHLSGGGDYVSSRHAVRVSDAAGRAVRSCLLTAAGGADIFTGDFALDEPAGVVRVEDFEDRRYEFDMDTGAGEP